jgi:DNA-binding MarR family transcriptional regulator
MGESLKARILQRKPFENFETEAYLNMVVLVQHLNDGVNRILKTKNLSMPQYNALRILRGAGEDGLTCGDVGKRMVHRVPDVTRLLDRLEARKLVSRAREAHDRRVVRVWITDLGLEQIAPLDNVLRENHVKQMSGLNQEELRQMIALMEKARSVHEQTTGND